jgi:hypothetical protein
MKFIDAAGDECGMESVKGKKSIHLFCGTHELFPANCSHCIELNRRKARALANLLLKWANKAGGK